MKAGSLVRVIRPGIGVPFGALALISSVSRSNFDEFDIYELTLIGTERVIQRLEQDLEAIK
jgi:hypothetical protein